MFPRIQVTWSPNTESNIVSYTILRNYVPYGSFTQVGTVNHPTVTFTDSPSLETIPGSGGQGIMQGIIGEWYYSVIAVDDVGSMSPASLPVSYEQVQAFDNNPFVAQTIGNQVITFTPPDDFNDLSDNEDLKEYFERIRVHALWQLMQDGQMVWLYKRKVEGTKCPLWQDDAGQCLKPLGDPRFDVNTTCYNTGILGGYYSPVKVLLRIIPSGSAAVLKREGLRLEFPTRAWTIWTPRLANYDFFVTSEGKRFELTNITWQTVRGGLVTHQVGDVIQKWDTDHLYFVPVPGTLP